MCIVTIQLQTLAVLWPLFWLLSHRQDFEWAKTGNGGSSMASFLSCEPKLLTVAVVWPLFWVVKILSQNCKPWQLYGHFSEFVKSGHTTARVSSSMDTALELPRLAFLWTRPWNYRWPLFWLYFLTHMHSTHTMNESGVKVESYTELQLIRVLFEKLSHIQSRFNSMTFVLPIFVQSITVFKTSTQLQLNLT